MVRKTGTQKKDVSYSDALRSNIWKYQVLRCISSFLLMMPILIPFFQENGLTMSEILLLQSVFSVVIVLLEVPTGYLADVIGRRVSVISGYILLAAGFWVYSIGTGFWYFLLSEMIFGIGFALVSGAFEALIYDSLVELKETNRFKPIQGRASFSASVSEASAAVLGSLLALISLRTPFIAYAAILTCGAIMTFTLREPKRDVYMHQKGHLNRLASAVHLSLHGHKKLKWLIIFGAVISAGTLTATWLMQPYFQLVGIPLAWFGTLWAIQNLFVGFASHRAEAAEKWLGRRALLTSLPIIFVLATLILGLFPSVITIVALLAFSTVRGIQSVIVSDYVNSVAPSDIRATVLSTQSLMGRLFFAVLSPLIGYIVDVISLQTAFMVWGVMVFVGGLVSLSYLKSHKVV